MIASETIIIQLDHADQLVERCPPSPFRNRRLREEAEKYLVERVSALPRTTAARLRIIFPESERHEPNTVVETIHEHFSFLGVETEKKLKRIRRFGWRSLGVALIFLSVVMLVVQLIQRYLPEKNLVSVITAGLTIFAWVALWRPFELLLYERYPYKRDLRIFRKLEEAEIRVSYENTEQ